MAKQRRPRRAFSTVKGVIRTAGDPGIAAVLDRAWQEAQGDDRILTHGFHAYPARIHPLLVRTLLLRFSKEGDRVLDPFAGSGTVAVEALAHHRRGFGCDIHPVPLGIARQRTRRATAERRKRLESTAATLLSRAASRARNRPSLDADPELSTAFLAPVLDELLALRDELGMIRDAEHRETLLWILSSLLVKLSRQSSESDTRLEHGPAAKGLALRLFRERTVELNLARRALLHAAGPRSPESPDPVLVRADARHLPLPDACFDLMISSPPYLGTYDYAGMQALRARFLGLPAETASQLEIGSRSATKAEPVQALQRYREQLGQVLTEVDRTLRPGARAFLVLGDPTAGDDRLSADRLIGELVENTRLTVIATASQARHSDSKSRSAGARRMEHLIALLRSTEE